MIHCSSSYPSWSDLYHRISAVTSGKCLLGLCSRAQVLRPIQPGFPSCLLGVLRFLGDPAGGCTDAVGMGLKTVPERAGSKLKCAFTGYGLQAGVVAIQTTLWSCFMS